MSKKNTIELEAGDGLLSGECIKKYRVK